jgi:hypothetical protein
VKRTFHFVLLACLLAGPCLPSHAQSTQFQWWPEVDTYVALNSQLRASLFVARTTDGESADSLEIGPNLDVTLRSIRGRKAGGNDSSKQKYLTFRAGYHYIASTDKPDEKRGILELTPRYYLPRDILLSDRNRADLRVINGVFSWRYRNRVTLERNFKVKALTLTPYARGEVYYDSRYGIWNKNAYSFGVILPVGKHIELEPYFERENDSRSSTPHVNAIGFTFSLYLDPFRRNP